MTCKKLLLLLSLAILSNLSFAQEMPERKNNFTQKSERLKAKARNKKKIPVIIRLKAPFKPEGKINKAEIRKQRRFIRRIRNSVRNQVKGMIETDEKIIDFDKLPYLALRVSPRRLERLMRSPYVISIEEDVPLKGTLSESIPLTNGSAGFAQGYSGSGQTVAVIDSGVRTDHEFFKDRIVAEACFSGAGVQQDSLCPGQELSSFATGSANDCDLSIAGCGHGTHVAGIAVGSNAEFSGIAKDANLIAIKSASKVTTSNGSAYVSHFNADLASALMRVYDLREQYKIAAVNLSIGNNNILNTGSCDDVTPIITDAINLLKSVGIATIVSSGNASQTNRMAFPACISSAISVGNSVSELQSNSPAYQVDDVWFDSNISAQTDLLAPGTKILSAGSASSTEYVERWGTSMAAPHVAGAFAVLRSKNPDASISELLSALKDGGLPRLDQRSGGTHTVPRIDIANALAFIQTSTQNPNTPTIPTPTSPTGGEVTTTTPALSWRAVPGTDTYIINAWSGDQPLSAANQVIGNAVPASYANCDQVGATTCTYTFRNQPFKDNQTANWMVRASGSGKDSTPASFSVNTGTQTTPPGGNSTNTAEPEPISPSGGASVNSLIPELSWTAKSGTSLYIINAWNGQQPLSRSNQVIGHVVTAHSAGCAQTDATRCTYTFVNLPFPDNTSANWMVRTNDSGTNSTPAVFNINVAGVTSPTPTPTPDTSIPNACQQGSTPISSGRITAGKALCLQDTSGGRQVQMHIYVSSQNATGSLRVQTQHGSGEGTLLHRKNGRPRANNYDTIADTVGTTEDMLVTDLRKGWNYIHFSTSSGFSGVSLLAEFE